MKRTLFNLFQTLEMLPRDSESPSVTSNPGHYKSRDGLIGFIKNNKMNFRPMIYDDVVGF